jgi:hypothetical protein
VRALGGAKLIFSSFLFLIMIAGVSLSAKNKSEFCKMSIAKLRPTQYSVGKEEIRRKTAFIKEIKANKKKLAAYLKKKTAPVILGPNGDMYLVDHHHTALAFLRAGVNKMLVQVIADFSHFSREEFWNHAASQGWARLVNRNGKPIQWHQLDRIKRLKKLKDDPYRSLAGMLRDAGGFKKTDQPYMEFKWADFLRDKIATPGEKISWYEALEQALQIAKRSSPNR